jgi:hypothetical protein
MKVYAIMQGCRYEGGYLYSAHASRESALAAVAILLKHEADLLAESSREDPIWDFSGLLYSEERPDFWSNGADFISITELDLIGAPVP